VLTENAQLFDAHKDGLCRYLTRIVGQPDAARDLTQEVFLRVSRTPVPDATADGQRAWIFRIARNLALNHLRDSRRRPATTALVDVGRSGTQELSVAVQQALEALPELDRDVFLLKESAGLAYEEIAAACEITPDAVRSRLHRARQQLRASLGSVIGIQLQRGVRLTQGQ
jgi:RNA polymerase sigma-70 factor (ECF subfamily)